MQNNLFIGKVAKFLSTVDSTNAFAINLLAKTNPIEGTVIYTDKQQAGRGQIGSKWESQAGKNIIMSVILYPDFLPVVHQFKLNQVVALAVYDLYVFVSPDGIGWKEYHNVCYSVPGFFTYYTSIQIKSSGCSVCL